MSAPVTRAYSHHSRSRVHSFSEDTIIYLYVPIVKLYGLNDDIHTSRGGGCA